MKVKKFNNLWAMGLILFGAILVAFYLAKIFFPEFIVGVAEIPAIVNFGNLIDGERLCKYCYSNYLRNVLGYKEVNCNMLTIGEFADLHPNGTYLIRIQGHLTCVKEPSTVWDIWDCRAKMCDLAWEIR